MESVLKALFACICVILIVLLMGVYPTVAVSITSLAIVAMFLLSK